MKTSPLAATRYHVHVYCELNQLEICDHVRTNLLDSIPAIAGAGPVRNRPIGPHPLPMFEAWFQALHLDEVMRWMMANRNGLSVMFHPLSGSDLADHAEHSIWLGRPLPLKLEIFNEL